MKRVPYRRYTDEFKNQAIALAESVGSTEASRRLDMPTKTLEHWLGASRSGKPLRSPAVAPVDDVQSELARLRAENATLKMEREILKKAAVFFAKESK